jgi:predicted amidohydrolase YtcJ
MTREEALASMTIWAARANFQDKVAGSITPGKYADFVLVDRDWLRVAPDAIERTEILATYFSGRRVYGAV